MGDPVSCSEGLDCAGKCGGSAVMDCAGTCNGPYLDENSVDGLGTDECGICDGDGYDDDYFDSMSMCCACGGGSTGGRDVSDSHNLKLNIPDSGPQIEGKINGFKYGKNPADVIQPKTPVGRKAAGAGFESRLQRANSVKLIQTAEGLKYEANGYVGFEITLEHGTDFEIDVTKSAFIAEFKTVGNTTKVVVINDETTELFNSTGDFAIVDVIAGTAGGTAVATDIVSVPDAFGLGQAYPNPFNPSTSVELVMPTDGFVSLKVYNLVGQVIATLHEGNLTANSYTFTWDAGNVASRMYFLKAETAGNVDVQKIMLMK